MSSFVVSVQNITIYVEWIVVKLIQEEITNCFTWNIYMINKGSKHWQFYEKFKYFVFLSRNLGQGSHTYRIDKHNFINVFFVICGSSSNKWTWEATGNYISLFFNNILDKIADDLYKEEISVCNSSFFRTSAS